MGKSKAQTIEVKQTKKEEKEKQSTEIIIDSSFKLPHITQPDYSSNYAQNGFKYADIPTIVDLDDITKHSSRCQILKSSKIGKAMTQMTANTL